MAWCIHTKFHDDRFGNSSNIKGITSTMSKAIMLMLLIEGIYEIRLLDDFTWHDIYTKFHEHLFRRSSNIQFFPQKFERL
jgi:hypothetical protein